LHIFSAQETPGPDQRNRAVQTTRAREQTQRETPEKATRKGNHRFVAQNPGRGKEVVGDPAQIGECAPCRSAVRTDSGEFLATASFHAKLAKK
jgi:hypothetical protein